MQTNVDAKQWVEPIKSPHTPNAINSLNLIETNFGKDNVKTFLDGSFRLKVKEMGNGDILTISNTLIMADIKICRSDKNIIVLFFPR